MECLLLLLRLLLSTARALGSKAHNYLTQHPFMDIKANILLSIHRLSFAERETSSFHHKASRLRRLHARHWCAASLWDYAVLRQRMLVWPCAACASSVIGLAAGPLLVAFGQSERCGEDKGWKEKLKTLCISMTLQDFDWFAIRYGAWVSL